MSVIGNQTNLNETQYFFIEVNSKVINTSTITANSAAIGQLTSRVINTSTITTNTGAFNTITLRTPSGGTWDANTVYSSNAFVGYSNTGYFAVTSNLNVPPGTMPLWLPNTPYLVNNIVAVVGIGTYRCIQNTPGTVFPPNSELSLFSFITPSILPTVVWTTTSTIPPSGISGDTNSFINVGNANISTITSYNVSSIFGSFSTINTNNLGIDSLTAKTINLSSIGGSPSGIWNSNRIYTTNNTVEYNSNYYISLANNLNVTPGCNIPLWIPDTGVYVKSNYTFQEGEVYSGTYVCIEDIANSAMPPSGDPTHWAEFRLDTNAGSNIWRPFTPSGITGDTYSYVNVGRANISTIKSYDFSSLTGYVSSLRTDNISSLTGYISTLRTDHLSSQTVSISSLNATYISSPIVAVSSLLANWITTSNIQAGFSYISSLYASVANFSTIYVSSLHISSIINSNLNLNDLTVINLYSSNIYNSNALQTNTLNVTNLSQFNTVSASGQVITNDILSANADINLGNNMSINGRTNSYASYDGTQTQFFNSINNILDTTTNSLTVIGCGTGNGFDPFLPLRNNSIVNIGETQFAPGIVTIYGVSADLTTALTVYGITSITGDTTINGLLTVNGVADLNGDTTVLGFLECAGTLDVQGLTTFTGAVNSLGLMTIEGEINITGTFTAQAGIAVIGATDFTVGDMTFGTSPAGTPENNYSFNCYYIDANFERITVNQNGDFRKDVGVAGTLTTSNLVARNINTSNLVVANLTASNINISNISLPSIAVDHINSYSTGNVSMSAPVYIKENAGNNAQLLFENSNATIARLELDQDGVLAINSDSAVSITGNNTVAIGGSNIIMYSLDPVAIASQVVLKEVPELSSNLPKLIFENSNASQVGSIVLDNARGLLMSNVNNIEMLGTSLLGGERARITMADAFDSSTGTLEFGFCNFSFNRNIGVPNISGNIATFDDVIIDNIYVNGGDYINMYAPLKIIENQVFPPTITFLNSNATRTASIDFDPSINLLSIQASNLTFTGGQTASLTAPQTNVLGQTNVGIVAGRTVNILADSNVFMRGISSIVMNSDDINIFGQSNVVIGSIGGGNTLGLVSVDGLVIVNGSEIQLNAQSNLNITGGGQLLTQFEQEIQITSQSNITLEATNELALGGLETVQLVSINGNVNINTLDIGGNIAVGALGGGNVVIASGSNTGIAIGNSESISLEASNYFKVLRGSATVSAENNIDYISYAGDIILGAPSGKVRVNSSNLNVLGSISTLAISTGTINVGSIVATGNATASNITTPALSTITISTATLNANFITAPVNVNFGKSLIPSGATIDLGATGFNYRQLFISSIRCVSSIITSTITTDRLFPTFDSGVRTGNLYPNSAGAQFGFGPALASGGFYNIGNFRSTITTNIRPASDGATTADNIKVSGHLSTVSLGVSTINFKPYPFISTLNNPRVTTTASISLATPSLTRLQSNTLTFPFPGQYKVYQEYSLTKDSGGGATHGSLIYDSNGATTTSVVNYSNWSRMGITNVPFQDKNGYLMMTTGVTSILVNSGNLTRDIYYYEPGTGSYDVTFDLAPPQIEYIPRPGILPEA